jgi:hypothetical protein
MIELPQATKCQFLFEGQNLYVIEGHEGFWVSLCDVDLMFVNEIDYYNRIVNCILNEEIILANYTKHRFFLRNKKAEEKLIKYAEIANVPRDKKVDFENTLKQLRKTNGK